jgi:hypothetical protein
MPSSKPTLVKMIMKRIENNPIMARIIVAGEGVNKVGAVAGAMVAIGTVLAFVAHLLLSPSKPTLTTPYIDSFTDGASLKVTISSHENNIHAYRVGPGDVIVWSSAGTEQNPADVRVETGTGDPVLFDLPGNGGLELRATFRPVFGDLTTARIRITLHSTDKSGEVKMEAKAVPVTNYDYPFGKPKPAGSPP